MRALPALLAAALLAGCSGGARSPDDRPSPGIDPATPTGTVVETPPHDAAPPDLVPPLHPSVDDYGETVLEVAGTQLGVLVANTPDERRHGLMDVPELPDGVGMLFVFEDDGRGGFWMKNTLVPLAIAFISADGTILEILDMEPCPSGENCPSYRPDAEYRYALEVPKGWFERVGVAPGAVVSGLPVESTSQS